jgi:hypothetical protein
MWHCTSFRGVKLTTLSPSSAKFKNHGCYSLLSLYAFMARRGQLYLNFTLSFYGMLFFEGLQQNQKERSEKYELGDRHSSV